MSDHGRSQARWPSRVLSHSLAMAVILAFAHGGLVCHAQLPVAWPTVMLEDAGLNAVCFQDAKQGWAVGDRGAILATEDGGQTWQLQAAPVTCELDSVCFIDAQQGWAVGGYATASSHRSRGVVLRTRDGGGTWQRLPTTGQPWLRQVRMLDPQRGVAWGDGTTLCPSGVTRTADRGRSWQPLPGAELIRWTAGDYRSDGPPGADGHGFLLGDLSPMVLDGRRIQRGRAPASGAEGAMRAASWIDARRAIAVGDQGQVWFSSDGGRSWVDKSDRLPPGVVGQWNWRAVASDGRRIWIAGQPGTSVLASDDEGEHWRVFRTHQALGLRDLCVCDGQLWAVGELGAVLHSSDQGRSWEVQRGGARRAGLLAIFADEHQVPWPLIAKAAARDGWRCVVAIADRQPQVSDESAIQVPRAVRIAAATTAVGGAAGVTFRPSQGDPLPSLVRLIREWRPEVILVDPPGTAAADRFRSLVFAAAESAADPHALADQAVIADLKPWAVDSAAWACERTAPRVWMTVPAGEVITSWGRVLDEVVRSATCLIDESPPRSWATSYFVKEPLRLAPTNVARARDEPLKGIRRPAEATSVADAQRLRSVVTNQRAFQLIRTQLQEVLREEPNSDQQGRTRGIAVWGQVQAVVAQLDSQTAGLLLWDLAVQFRDAGQLSMAHQLLQQISQRHARDGVADVARREMIRLQTSDEWRWRFREVMPLGWPPLGPGTGQPQFQVLSNPTGQGILAVETLPLLGVPRRGQLSRPSLTGPLTGPDNELERLADHDDDDAAAADVPLAQGPPVAAVTHLAPVAGDGLRTVPVAEIAPQPLLRHLQAVDPVVASDPLVRLALASQLRQDGQHEPSRQQYTTVANTGLPRHWRATAGAELWFSQREGSLPAVAARCRSGARPHLDGQLGDPIWRAAHAVHWPLESEATAVGTGAPRPVTSVKWARDEQFLYLAISGRTDQPPPAGGTPARTRDPDLRGADRVEICLDVDRDYLSCWRLSVDRNGRVADACDEAQDWDPEWYVAQDSVRWGHGSQWQWTVEAAIAWEQLVPQIKTGDAWAVQIRRVLPGGDTHSWPAVPVGDRRSARWGLLLME